MLTILTAHSMTLTSNLTACFKSHKAIINSATKYCITFDFPWNSVEILRTYLHKGFISGPSARRTKDLLRLNRDQLRWVVGLLTGHCHLKGHLFKLGLTDDPTCGRCLQEDESATHSRCDCEAIAYLRFRHLGQFFMEPSDFYDAPIIKSYISFGV
jgi:hypothetical protein